MAILETFHRTQYEEFLDGAQSWFAYLRENTPILEVDGTLAVNYFVGKLSARVTNKCVTLLRFLVELRRVCGTQEYVELEAGLMAFVDSVQMKSGELPYAVHQTSDLETRPHFQCYQYNAFEYLNLVRYHELTGEARSRRIAERIAEFLPQGLDRDGSAFFDCSHGPRRVVYHGVAVATALSVSAARGREPHADLARTSMEWALGRQRSDGAFTYLLRDSGFLADRRCYPRNHSMILMHLLTASQLAGPANESITAGSAVLPSSPIEGAV